MSTLSIVPNKTDEESNSKRFISFFLGEELYAIPLMQVREVMALRQVSPIPNAPHYFLGVMNLRGEVISVVDLRLKLGMSAPRDAETTVIFCDFDGYVMGCVVNALDSVLPATPKEISDNPQLGSQKNNCVAGVIRKDSNMILILDLPKLFRNDLQHSEKAAG